MARQVAIALLLLSALVASAVGGYFARLLSEPETDEPIAPKDPLAEVCELAAEMERLRGIVAEVFDDLEGQGYDLSPNRGRHTSEDREVLRNWTAQYAEEFAALVDDALGVLLDARVLDGQGNPWAAPLVEYAEDRTAFYQSLLAAARKVESPGPYSRGARESLELGVYEALVLRCSESGHIENHEAPPTTDVSPGDAAAAQD